ncbi:glycosyl hydrolase family 28-related protein [Ralstonia syzygii]|uniref:glycosyl hydrolase family 28-related protein n=1 Tax=Ralstonia syzygii TaxID=28097 RepID=UPI003519153E
MTINSASRKAGPFLGDGIATSFPFTFKIFTKNDIQVALTNSSGAETQLVLDSDYSVAVNSDQTVSPGGTVTYPAKLAIGYKLTITGALQNLQPTSLPNNGPWYPKTVEDSLDRTVILVQQLKEQVDRSVKINVSDTSLTPLPSAGARANALVGFDASGNISLYSLPASVGAGDMRVDVFTAGVDFTPGVTTALNLSRAPGNQANAEVFFDAAFQGSDQWSVIGTILTTTTPIPVGVTKVFVRIGTTLSTQIPPASSVGDTQLTWGNVLERIVDSVAALATLNPAIYTRAFALGYGSPGDGGGGHYSYSAGTPQATANGGTIIASTIGTGCWLLAQTTVVSLKQFGAKGDGVTDDTTAIQNALTWACAGGKLLRVPTGLYIMTAGVTATLNNGTGINSGGLRLTMIGDGPGSVCFQYAGSASPTLFTFIGSYSDRLLLEGFRVQHTDQASVSNNGIGIKLISQVNTAMRDVHVFRMTTGVQCVDINSCEFDSCYFGYNYQGLTAQIGTVTYPNALTFRNCYFPSNYQYGAVILSAVTVTFDGCTFEANGLDNNGNVQASAAALAFSNGTNGMAALRVLGTYFEGNAGSADIYITHTATGGYVFQGNTFNRTDSVKFVSNNVVIDASALGAGSAPCRINWSGNGFMRAGSYVASTSRRYVNYAAGANFDQFYIDDDGTNSYQDASELPIIDATRATQYGAVSQVQARGLVTVSGGVATLTNNTGISSVTRASTGVFNVVLKRSVGSLALPQVQLGTGSMGWFYSNLTQNSFTINTYNAAGAATDPASFILTVDAGT